MAEELPWNMQVYKKSLSSTQRLIPLLEHVVVQASIEHNADRDTEHIHPSEMAKENWCTRQTWYRITGEPESDPDDYRLSRLNIFEEGNLVGEKWQRWMYEAGILVGMFKCLVCKHKWWAKSPALCPECESDLIKYAEVPLADPDHWIIGHADGLFEDEQGECLEETKTVGMGTVRIDAPNLFLAYSNGNISLDELWKRIKRPFSAHNKQLQIYMHCTGVHDGVVIYEWKPTQEVREFSVKYQPEIVAPLLKKCDEVIDAVENEWQPKRHPNATSKSCQVCTYCPYKATCWSNK